jgi:hypothetical protein
MARPVGQYVLAVRATHCGNEGRESCPSVLRPGAFLYAAEAKMPKSPLDQVIGRKPSDGRIVDVNKWERRVGHKPQYVDSRKPGLSNRACNCLCLDSGYDPIALPPT